MTATATAGARVVTFTTGTEVVKGTFTVTVPADTKTDDHCRLGFRRRDGSCDADRHGDSENRTGVPTGYISILETKEGLEDIVGTVQLSGGVATLPISNLTVGDHSFSAQYLGDTLSFAQSKTTADAKVKVTADPGKAALSTTATLQMLSNGAYEAIVTVANTGKGTAKKVAMTTATLGGITATSALPATLPDIAPGGSTTTLVEFPARCRNGRVGFGDEVRLNLHRRTFSPSVLWPQPWTSGAGTSC